jgi:hypothetical protein
MRKPILAAAALAGCAAVAYAQFPGGLSAVYDAAVDSDMVVEIAKVASEIQILTQTMQLTLSTYNQILANARMVSAKNGWMYALAPLRYPAASNAYGTSGGWTSSLNSGLASVQSYELATMRLASPYALVAKMSSVGQNTFAAQYSTVELNDGAAQNAMSVTGALRAQQAQRAAALKALQADSLSNDPSQNSEVGVLNKVNSAALIHAQAQQDTNSILAAIADQQTIELKVRHDALADEMNASVAAQAATQRNADALWSGNAAAHGARLP